MRLQEIYYINALLVKMHISRFYLANIYAKTGTHKNFYINALLRLKECNIKINRAKKENTKKLQEKIQHALGTHLTSKRALVTDILDILGTQW